MLRTLFLSSIFASFSLTSTLWGHGGIEGATGHIDLGSDGILQILPLGDSITSGETAYDTVGAGGYRTELERQLVGAGIPFDFVGSRVALGYGSGGGNLADPDHEGWGGSSLQDLTSVVTNSSGLSGEIELILLHAGTIDIAYNGGSLPAIATFEQQYHALIDAIRLRQPSATIIVSTLLPTRSDVGVTGLVSIAEVQQMNEAIHRVIDARADARLHLVDGFSAIDNPSTDILAVSQQNNPATGTPDGDGVHPSATGYSKLAELWYGAIQALYWEAEEFYEGSIDTGNGWRRSEVFGDFYDAGDHSEGWKYMATIGWIYTPAGDAPHQYLYDPAAGWMYSAHEYYPHIYRFDTTAWYWHDAAAGRSLYNYQTQQYEAF